MLAPYRAIKYRSCALIIFPKARDRTTNGPHALITHAQASAISAYALAFRCIARLAIEALKVGARTAPMIRLTIGFCLPGSLHIRGLGFDLGLLLAATVFRVAPLLLYAIRFRLGFRPVGGILARTAILFIDLLPSNSLRFCLGVGPRRRFPLALGLRLQSVVPRPVYGIVCVIFEKGRSHNAFLNEKPNATCGNAQDQDAADGFFEGHKTLPQSTGRDRARRHSDTGIWSAQP